MTTPTHHEISIERVAALIEAYGSNPRSWPEQERAVAMARIESSSQLQQLLNDARRLDTTLLAGHVEEPPDEVLLARIVDNLPPQQVAGRLAAKPGLLHTWPAAVAAGITGLAIMLAVMNNPQQAIQNEQLALQELDYWLWQDVTDQVSFDTSEESPTDFMSML
jgi:hypothetical protein